MQLGVLGPVALVSGGTLVALGGPKQRLVLGLLIANRGRVVPVDELIDGLWPDGPQAQPRKTVQVYVTRLRRALGVAADALTSEASGYRLDGDRIEIDADRFEPAVHAALAEPDDEAAASTLRGALGLWRGAAYVDLRDCEGILPTAVHLDELRLTATHELFERELRLRPHAVVAEIEQTVEANPLHEGFAAQLMSAQYRVGRQADALATYQALRRRLADELGVEPGPAVRDLHGRVIRHELEAMPAVNVVEPVRQLRRVTIVAVHFVIESAAGEVPDAEQEFALLSPLRRAAKARCAGHAGLLVAETGDTLTASFGYPSRGDAPVQAVAAALAMVALASGGDGRVGVHVGIETGDAVLEASSDGDGRLTGITGPPLRAAGMLRDLAEAGQVLLGTTIAELVGSDFELAPAAPGTAIVHGRRRLRRVREAGGLLARSEAISAVLDLVESPSGGVRTIGVAGPQGIGKTALVDAVIGQLDARWHTVRLYGERVHERGALQPFRPEFPELFESGAEPTVRQLIGALERRWHDHQRLLVVDDVDAVDPASFEVLDTLADHIADMALVVTTRDGRGLVLGGEPVPTVDLPPLGRDEARQLARSAARRQLGIAELNDIADRAGGNLWYVRELAAAADRADGGALAAVPMSLYDSLTGRLDRLGPARELAQRCSVLGAAFARPDVGLVAAELGEGTIDEHLAAMVAGGVVQLDGDAVRFTHALVAQIAHESMLQAERSRLHAEVARTLADRGRAAEPATLAYHLEASGDHAAAAVAWRRASSVAIRRSRNRDAQRHARRSLRIIDEHLDGGSDDPVVADLRARALLNLAYGVQATNHGSSELADTIALARHHGAGPPGSTVTLDLIDISNRQALGDFVGADEVARQSVIAFDSSTDEVSAAFARQFLGATMIWRGELVGGTDELQRAAAFWDDGGGVVDSLGARPLAALWGLLGLAGWFVGTPDAAVDDFLVRSLALIPDDDGDGRCLAGATFAVVQQLRGDTGEVRRLIEPVWPLAMDLGSEFWLGWAQALLGWAIAADDAAAGTAMIAETLERGETRQAIPYFAYLLANRLGEAGRFGDAVDRLAEAVAVATETGERLWIPLAECERARWLAADGQQAAAVAAADTALALALGQGAGRLAEVAARRLVANVGVS